jgi:hypothetical protein
VISRLKDGKNLRDPEASDATVNCCSFSKEQHQGDENGARYWDSQSMQVYKCMRIELLRRGWPAVDDVAQASRFEGPRRECKCGLTPEHAAPLPSGC